jgi:hypothetical protein
MLKLQYRYSYRLLRRLQLFEKCFEGGAWGRPCSGSSTKVRISSVQSLDHYISLYFSLCYFLSASSVRLCRMAVPKSGVLVRFSDCIAAGFCCRMNRLKLRQWNVVIVVAIVVVVVVVVVTS